MSTYQYKIVVEHYAEKIYSSVKTITESVNDILQDMGSSHKMSLRVSTSIFMDVNRWLSKDEIEQMKLIIINQFKKSFEDNTAEIESFELVTSA